MHFSTNLDINGKLLMIIFCISSSPNFLNRGLIIAVFQLFTKVPSVNDMLTNSVIIPIMCSAKSLKDWMVMDHFHRFLQPCF